MHILSYSYMSKYIYKVCLAVNILLSMLMVKI